MLAVGCLIPFMTLVAGAVLGSYLGEARGGYWGAGIGFGVGLVIAAAGIVLLGRLRSRA